jgi:D-glucuronyl C5-epimerase C-terminus
MLCAVGSGRERRVVAAGAVVPAVSAVLLAAVAGCGGARSPAIPADRDVPALALPRPLLAPAAAVPSPAAGLAAHEAQRLEEIQRLRAIPTVDAALRLALLTGDITFRRYARLAGIEGAARATLGRLTGVRRLELGAVIAALDGLAARGMLTPSRFAAAFLVVRRNTAFWTRRPLPAPAQRTSFGRDPAVFQYYPGHGMQLQPLASWGRVNAVARLCLRARRAGRRHACPRRSLRRRVDALARLAARRSGFAAWEYYFAYAGGRPPWISGMTQATAAQTLARAARVLHAPRDARLAREALGAFERPPPIGVSMPAAGGRRYAMYSFEPGLRILNGELQAVTGLTDVGALARSAPARHLARAGAAAAGRALPAFDTGAWSLYSEHGLESSLNYHVLTTRFLGDLCARRGRPFCAAHRRFARYLREPPRVGLAPLGRLRPFLPVALRFTLSKVSTVRTRVWSARGTSLDTTLFLARGSHVLLWTPPAAGRFGLRIDARGPNGRHGIERRTLVVEPPPATADRPPRPRAAPPHPRPGHRRAAHRPPPRHPRRHGSAKRPHATPAPAPQAPPPAVPPPGGGAPAPSATVPAPPAAAAPAPQPAPAPPETPPADPPTDPGA